MSDTSNTSNNVNVSPTSTASITSTTSTTSTTSNTSNTGPVALYFQMYRLGETLSSTSAKTILSLLPSSYANRQVNLILCFQCANVGGTVTTGSGDSFVAFTKQAALAKTFISELKSANRKVTVSIGGEKGYDTGWPNLINSATIATFVKSMKTFIDTFGFNGYDVDYEELQSVEKTDPNYNVLQQQRLSIVQALRAAMPSPTYYASITGWSVGACTPTLCPQFKTGTNVGMDIPVLSNATVRNSFDAWHIMSYYTGLESNAAEQMKNTVSAFAASGVAKAKLFGGIILGQYTVTTANNFVTLLHSQGYNAYLWDLYSGTTQFLAIL